MLWEIICIIRVCWDPLFLNDLLNSVLKELDGKVCVFFCLHQLSSRVKEVELLG